MPIVTLFLKKNAFEKEVIRLLVGGWGEEVSEDLRSESLLPRIRLRSFSVEEISSFLAKVVLRFLKFPQLGAFRNSFLEVLGHLRYFHSIYSFVKFFKHYLIKIYFSRIFNLNIKIQKELINYLNFEIAFIRRSNIKH
jgi:hypothetical protein